MERSAEKVWYESKPIDWLESGIQNEIPEILKDEIANHESFNPLFNFDDIKSVGWHFKQDNVPYIHLDEENNNDDNSESVHVKIL